MLIVIHDMHHTVYVFIRASFLETTYKCKSHLPSVAPIYKGKRTGIINS